MSIIPSEDSSFRGLARYGVPAVILLFYVSASQRFDYTPHSTFGVLNNLNAGGAESLWTALLSVAQALGIEALLAAKVLSLLLSCCTILLTYLIAYEVLAEHLSSFCAALAFVMQAWLLQLGASGSGLGFLTFLTLSAIFFMLRNEYILASLFAGLSSLVAWQAGALVFVLLLDVYVNSVDKRRATKLMASVIMIFGGVVLPWVLFSIYKGTLLMPDEAAVSDVPTLTPETVFGAVLLIGMMFVGVVLLAMRQRELLRSYTAVVLWTVSVSFLHRAMFALALPLILVFAFLAARSIVRILGASHAAPVVAVLLAAAILAYNQFVAYPPVEMRMQEAAANVTELKSVSTWLNENAGAAEAAFVPLSDRDIVTYFSDRTTSDSASVLIVSKENEVTGCDIVYDPARQDPELISRSEHYKIWRRR